MAFERAGTIPMGRGALTCGSDLSGKAGYTASISSEVVAIGADDGAGAIGIILDGGLGTSGDIVSVGFGWCGAIAGAAVDTGDQISADSAGRIITAASGDAVIGKALSKATAAGDELDVFIYGVVDESVA